MATNGPLDVLAERLRAEYEARASKLNTIKGLIAALRTVLEENPEYRVAVAGELRPLIEGTAIENRTTHLVDNASDVPALTDENDDAYDLSETEEETEEEAGGGTVADRLIAFLRARGNAPASITTLSVAARAKATTVRGILYKPRRNRGRFVQVKLASAPAESHWRLSDLSDIFQSIPSLCDMTEGGDR